MRDLVIMPAMAQRRESLNMGEFAEEAIIVEEVAAPKRVNHFIEANTQEVTLQQLKITFMESSLICQRLESHTLSMVEYQVH